MKIITIIKLLIIILTTAFTSCCKLDIYDLPEPNCYHVNLKLISTYPNTNSVDSLRVRIKRIGEDKSFVNLPLTKPSNGFEFGSSFCGDFEYIIDFYHIESQKGWDAKLIVNGDTIVKDFGINGDSRLEGKYPL